MTANTLREALLSLVPADGATIGNMRLRQALTAPRRVDGIAGGALQAIVVEWLQTGRASAADVHEWPARG